VSGLPVIAESSVPRLAAHVRLRFDKQREQWVLLAPERIFVLDEIALAIVERCQGSATLAEVVDDLARTFEAPREQVLADAGALLQGFLDKGVMTL
jgi:pyrroloquinoline quinone biosynthesis protein D